MFADRAEAGQRLARELRESERSYDLVAGVARGGVPVAAEIARALDIPLKAVVSNKIRSPYNPELAIGAVGEDGSHLREERILSISDITPEQFERARAEALRELRRRVEVYGSVGEAAEGRTVILADDGVATGMTLRAALLSLRNMGAAHIIVAVPVASRDAAAQLMRESDEAVILQTPHAFMAVGQYYRRFPPVTDEQVLGHLEESSKE